MVFNLKELRNKLANTDVLFFDLDGTLIDTEPLYFRFWKEATEFYGRELSDTEALSMRSRDNQSARAFLTEISNGVLDYDLVKAKRIELMSNYLKVYPIQLKPFAKEFVRKMKKLGKTIYIVTSNTVDKAARIIKEIGFASFVDNIISAKDVERGKPHPDVYLKAAEVANVDIKGVIVFEDSPNGLISSFDSGAYTVMIEDIDEYNPSMNYVHAAIKSFKDII